MQQDKVVRRRRRWSDEEKRALLEAWRRSDESARSFARREGIQKTCLWRWQRDTGLSISPKIEPRAAAITFAPVRSVERAPPTVRGDERVVAEVVVRDVRVRVLEGADAALVASLVKALGGSGC